MTKQRLRLLAEEVVDMHVPERPRTRGDCVGGERPCPWVGCKWHLAIDVSRNGSIKHNWPDVEPGEWLNSCALDAADHGGLTVEQVAELMNVTRERVRQVEMIAMTNLMRNYEAAVVMRDLRNVVLEQDKLSGFDGA